MKARLGIDVPAHRILGTLQSAAGAPRIDGEPRHRPAAAVQRRRSGGHRGRRDGRVHRPDRHAAGSRTARWLRSRPRPAHACNACAHDRPRLNRYPRTLEGEAMFHDGAYMVGILVLVAVLDRLCWRRSSGGFGVRRRAGKPPRETPHEVLRRRLAAGGSRRRVRTAKALLDPRRAGRRLLPADIHSTPTDDSYLMHHVPARPGSPRWRLRLLPGRAKPRPGLPVATLNHPRRTAWNG